MPDNWTLSFIVTGAPVPQGSKNVLPKRGGGFVLVEGSPKHHQEWKMWRSLVHAAAMSYKNRAKRDPQLRVEVEGLQAGPLDVDLLFWLARPKSAPKSRWAPDVKPDADKLTRAVFDGCTDAGVWKDDAQVCRFSVSKVYADARTEPGVRVKVRPLIEGGVAL